MLWLLIIPILFLGVCVAFSFVISHKQKQKVFVSPTEFGLAFEDIRLHTSDGIRLEGWWIPAGQTRRTIIFLHGYGGTYDPDLKYVPAFHDAGFNVMMFDFRAHGRSGGHYTTVGALEQRDCLAAIDFAVGRGSLSIGLFGFSMGGRVAILSAPQRPQVKAVISDGGPPRLNIIAAYELQKRGAYRGLSKILAFMMELGMCIGSGVNVFRLEPYVQAKKLSPLPVMFIHGGHDPYTRLDDLESMVKAAGSNAEIWRVDEAGHRDADVFRPEEYNQRVLTFFEHWLPEP
jgi:pimeloyl-ACP methyl ester carboxylesterase